MTISHGKIELHQLLNTILIAIVGFIAAETYMEIKEDHERLAVHETRITVVENSENRHENAINFLTGRVDEIGSQTRKHYVEPDN